jgi:hypothetical protein
MVPFFKWGNPVIKASASLLRVLSVHFAAKVVLKVQKVHLTMFVLYVGLSASFCLEFV